MKDGIGGGRWHGNSMFGSINDHRGVGRSRRDDLERCATCSSTSSGSLPWSDVRAANKRQEVMKITELKLSTPIATLCAGLPWNSPSFWSMPEISLALQLGLIIFI
ncbi:Discs overgrown protein kinase [Orchesella cincta]|uniref:Discs overgrown protein kinase n=1 Tax=Orchesella cincta TaxID=48709 RepID=A0A1D2N2W0_ORCCI|nr:Discs overgrown protein kinase [Orchesella cincta]